MKTATAVMPICFCPLQPAFLFAGSSAPPGKAAAPAARSVGLRFSAGFLSRSVEGVSWLTGTRSTPAMFSIGAGSNTASINAIGTTDAFADWMYLRRNGAPPVRLRQWHEGRAGTDLLAGVFFQASVLRQLNERWFLSATGRYDAVRAFNIAAGPSTGSVEVSGWSVGVAVGVNF